MTPAHSNSLIALCALLILLVKIAVCKPKGDLLQHAIACSKFFTFEIVTTGPKTSLQLAVSLSQSAFKMVGV